MSEVFLCKTGSLSRRTVRDLRKAGIVVVEADDPKDCQFIRSTEVVSGGAMLVAALTAIGVGKDYDKRDEIRATFVHELFKAATLSIPERTSKAGE